MYIYLIVFVFRALVAHSFRGCALKAAYNVNKWIFGDIICRLQSTSIEISYTVSIITLVTVALERYLSICYPYKRKRTVRQSIYTSVFIWVFAVMFCGVLVSGYQGRKEGGKYICNNDPWSKQSRLIFYTVHSVIVYILPLVILLVAHYKISRVLESQRIRSRERLHTNRRSTSETNHVETNNISNVMVSTDGHSTLEYKPSPLGDKQITECNPKERSKSMRTLTRRSNIIRLLIVITTIFLVLWTPFIVVRLLMYADVKINEVVFVATQLLIFTNTAVNFTVYAFMSTSFRTAFKTLFTCNANDSRVWNNVSISKSLDLTDTLRKQFSITKAVPKEKAMPKEATCRADI